MSARKTNDTKVATVCCSVRTKYKDAITKYVEKEGGSTANVMGKILEKWVDDTGLLNLPAIEILEFKDD